MDEEASWVIDWAVSVARCLDKKYSRSVANYYVKSYRRTQGLIGSGAV